MNKYLEKIALAEAPIEVKPRSEPKEHQNRILAKLDQNSVIAAHSMGSGKTLTALLAAEKAHKDFPHEHVTAIVPASLVTNMKEQIAQHGVNIDPERFETITYDKAVNDLKRLQGKNHSLIIVDEAHRLRNKDTKRSTELNKLLKSSRKNLLLTGTPSYNKPEDIAVLVNQAAGAKVLPDTGKDFEDKFIGRRKVSPGFMAEHVLGVKPGEVTYLKNQGELRDALKKYVDTYDAQTTNAEDFPTQTHKTVKVNMDNDQKRIYKFLEDDIPAPVRWKIRLGLPLNKKESADLNSFSTGVRQASNNIRPYVKNPHEAGISPKQKRMADSIQERVGTDKNYRGISYSNYLESGLRPLHEELTSRGIQSEIFDGSLSQKEKDKLVERYNSGDLKHMMVSSSGSEGLNLKGTKLVQIMEPHFNKSKIDQMVARGVRYKSHEHLPHEERHVDVEHYHSVMEPGMVDKILGQKTKTIDEYLSDMSDSKEKVKNDIMNLVKTAELSKQALNALKARALAQEAGVVVDPRTSWKWALRQFRDSKGGIKTGREKAEVLNRLLGKPRAGSNNFIQAIRSEQRKIREVDEVQLSRPRNKKEYDEFTGVDRGSNSLQAYPTSGGMYDLSNSRLQGGHSIHVHPTTGVPLLYRTATSKDWSIPGRYTEVDSRVFGGTHYAAGPSGSYDKAPGYKTGLDIRKGGDVSAQMNRDKYVNQPFNILSGNTLGLHRMIYSGRDPAAYRQAYLDITQRKIKTGNPS